MATGEKQHICPLPYRPADRNGNAIRCKRLEQASPGSVREWNFVQIPSLAPSWASKVHTSNNTPCLFSFCAVEFQVDLIIMSTEYITIQFSMYRYRYLPSGKFLSPTARFVRFPCWAKQK
jgi:hypothetical protein